MFNLRKAIYQVKLCSLKEVVKPLATQIYSRTFYCAVGKHSESTNLCQAAHFQPDFLFWIMVSVILQRSSTNLTTFTDTPVSVSCTVMPSNLMINYWGIYPYTENGPIKWQKIP